MKIRIGHLYYNILNLYGTPSEIKVISQQLEAQGIKVEVDRLELHEKICFADYDFIYLGASTEENMLMCLEDLLKYSHEIKDFIENKIIYASGNSVNMFGKSIDDKQALNTFGYRAREMKKRVVSEVLLKHSDIKKPVIGVINQHYVLENKSNATFSLIERIERFPSISEGYEAKGFIGTNLVGPPLCRNPHFAEYVVNRIIRSKYPEYSMKEYDLKEEKAAYDYFMYRYHRNLL